MFESAINIWYKEKDAALELGGIILSQQIKFMLMVTTSFPWWFRLVSFGTIMSDTSTLNVISLEARNEHFCCCAMQHIVAKYFVPHLIV